MVPELDFGERMTVSGNSGCNLLTGQGVLRAQSFVVAAAASTLRLCGSRANEVERRFLAVLGHESVIRIIRIDQGASLALEADGEHLRFRLDDWR